MAEIHSLGTSGGYRRVSLGLAAKRPTLAGALVKLTLALLLASVLMSGAAFAAQGHLYM
jgi:hypothetical protein